MTRKLFPALMAGELSDAQSGPAEEHLQTCEDCSREFEAYESRFFGQYEPAGKAIQAAAKLPLPEERLRNFEASLHARLHGDCRRIEGMFTPFLSDELSTVRRDEMASHLQSCEACSRSFEAYESRVFLQVERAGVALAAAAKIGPPEQGLIGFWQKVSARIAQDRRSSAWRRATWALNIAALLVIGVSVGYLASGGRPADPAPELPSTVAHPGARVLPPNVEGAGAALPVSGTLPQRRYSIDNVRAGEADPRHRAGGLDVIQSEGRHGVDSVRPLQDRDGVGF